MKQYDIFVSNHHDFDIRTGIATYLSSLVVRSEIGVFHRLMEAMRKNSSISASIGIDSVCQESVSKHVKTEHRMALYTTVGPYTSKKTQFLHHTGLLQGVKALYRYVLQSDPVKTIIGFRGNFIPVVIRGNYNMNTKFSMFHMLSDTVRKSIGCANVISLESGVALGANSNTSFSHGIGTILNFGRVNLIDHVKPRYDVSISCSVTPLYVSLRTLGDMADTTLGELNPMTLEEVQIKQTL